MAKKPDSTWLQRDNFIRLITAFAEANGYLNQRGNPNTETLAEIFGLEAESFRQIFQNTTRGRPGLDTLETIAKIIKCSLREFIDDLGAPPGLDQERWLYIQERDRTIGRMMFHDITADDLTEQEKDELYESWKEAVLRVRRRKAAIKT